MKKNRKKKKVSKSKRRRRNLRSGSKGIKKALLTSDAKCDICGGSMSLQLHHVYPIRHGFKTERKHCKLLCANCHVDFHKRWDKYIDQLLIENPNVDLMEVYEKLKIL